MKLSVIVPVYNEQNTIVPVVLKVLQSRVIDEVIVVNDGSTDYTARVLRRLKHRKLRIFHKENGGKGSAIRLGLTHVTSDYTLIQDADLEYDPDDIPALIEPVTKGKAQVIYGSRFLGPHSNLLFWHWVGNSFLNLVVNVLYNTTLADMETCYKLVPTKLLREIDIRSNAFDIEPEITCKLLKQGIRIFEVPISYVGRDFSEGKKITWRDGIDALKTIVMLRLR